MRSVDEGILSVSIPASYAASVPLLGPNPCSVGGVDGEHSVSCSYSVPVVLTPQGRALVGEVNPRSDPEAIKRFADDFTDTWWLWNRPYRLWLHHGVLPKGYTSTELEQLSHQAGFSESIINSPKDWILVWVDLGR